MVQGMENTDDQGVILLTVPSQANSQDNVQNSAASAQVAGEGYSLTRLIDGSQEESKEAAGNNDDDLDDDLTGIQPETTESVQGATNSVESADSKLLVDSWSEEQEINPNLPHQPRNVHVRTAVLNNRFYVFQNLSASNPQAIKVIDPSLRRIF